MLQKYVKCWVSLKKLRMHTKVWGSVTNGEKVWKKVLNIETVCWMLRKYEKLGERVLIVEKVY